MITDNASDHNAQGLKDLRNRYVRRAVHLASSRGAGSFHETLDSARRIWNERFAAFAIEVQRIQVPPNIERSAQINGIGGRMYMPSGLREHTAFDLEHPYMRWVEFVDSLCLRFWPARDFDLPFGELTPPAATFVSAALLYDSWMFADETIDGLFPRFSLQPSALPYRPQPFDGERMAELEAQVSFLQSTLRTYVDDDTEYQALMSECMTQGRLAARSARDQQKPWVFVPILPGTSSQDIRAATSDIVDAAKRYYQSRPLNQRITELAEEQLSQGAIADLLGVDRGRVNRAIKDVEK